MKHIITAAVCLALLFAGCKKSSDSTPSGGNNGGNNGNPPGSKGKITITSINPANPHPDNHITINGTGFNADKTRDIVYFGNYDTTTKKFSAYGSSNVLDYKSTIFSASATQLVVQTLDSSYLNIDVLDAPEYRKVPAMQVIANGDTAVVITPFQEMVRIQAVADPEQPAQSIPGGWPGDSLYVTCNGVVDKTATLTIGTATCPFTPVVTTGNNYHFTVLHTYVPKTLASSNNDTLTHLLPVKLDLADGTGTIEEADYQFYLSPVMRITKITPAQSTYSHGTLTGSGGVINLDVVGRNLKSDAIFTLVIYGTPGVVATGPLEAIGYPDQATITLPGSLAPNAYVLNVTRTNPVNGKITQYGGCQFIVSP